MKPLKSLVSRTIIELLIHNIENKEDLNSKITELGYGNRNQISENYKHYALNVSTLIDTNWKEL